LPIDNRNFILFQILSGARIVTFALFVLAFDDDSHQRFGIILAGGYLVLIPLFPPGLIRIDTILKILRHSPPKIRMLSDTYIFWWSRRTLFPHFLRDWSFIHLHLSGVRASPCPMVQVRPNEGASKQFFDNSYQMFHSFTLHVAGVNTESVAIVCGITIRSPKIIIAWE